MATTVSHAFKLKNILKFSLLLRRYACYQSSVTPENQEYSGSKAKWFLNNNNSLKLKHQWLDKIGLHTDAPVKALKMGALRMRALPLGSIPFIFIQFSVKIFRNNRFSPPPQKLAAPPRLGNPGFATVKDIFAKIFSFSFPQVHTYDEDSCSCRCNNEHDAVRCAANQHWENMQCACVCNEKPSCAHDEVFNNSTCRYWSFP